MAEPAIPRKRRRRLRTVSVLRLGFLLAIYGASFAAAAVFYAVQTINDELPKDLSALLDYQPSRKSVVLSSDGEEIGAFSIENRRIVALDRMPPHVPAAFLSAEDRRFYKHKGFDLLGIVRAAITNFRSEGNIKQGGSTITQQIIKQTLLVGEEQIGALDLTPAEYARERKSRKYRRKAKELILAVRLERELTKAEILSIYLNHVYLGHGAYGVGAAAESYFGKEVEDLTIAEAAMLGGLVASPTKYAPHRNMQLARERQRYVLGHMRDDQYISNAEYEAALAEPIALVDDSDLNHLASPYFVEHIRQLATRRYGNRDLFRGGLKYRRSCALPSDPRRDGKMDDTFCRRSRSFHHRRLLRHDERAYQTFKLSCRAYYFKRATGHLDTCSSINLFRISTCSGACSGNCRREMQYERLEEIP